MTLQYACADVDSLAGALALGAVDAEELRAAREHLAGCPEPHAELRSLVGADGVLAASVEPVQPSAALRDRLMASVAATPQDRAEPAAVAPSRAAERAAAPRAAQPSERRGWLDWLSPNIARPLAVVAVLALIAVGVFGYAASSRLSEQRDALRAVADAIAAGEPTHPVDGSAGRGFVVDTAGPGASFVVTDANALEANQLYVLWLIDAEGTPVDVGAFEPTDSEVVVPVEDDLSGFQTFAVTVEAERVDAPTGAPVMAGALEG